MRFIVVHVILRYCVDLTLALIAAVSKYELWVPEVVLHNVHCCCICIIGSPQAAEASSSGSDDNSDVEIVFIREPTAEQAALARKLLLPLTFFCYKNEPGYTSDDEPDGETWCWFMKSAKQTKLWLWCILYNSTKHQANLLRKSIIFHKYQHLIEENVTTLIQEFWFCMLDQQI